MLQSRACQPVATWACTLAPPAPPVWFMGLASGAVAMASCTINDYFDADIDAVNDPQKPVWQLLLLLPGAAWRCCCSAAATACDQGL